MEKGSEHIKVRKVKGKRNRMVGKVEEGGKKVRRWTSETGWWECLVEGAESASLAEKDWRAYQGKEVGALSGRQVSGRGAKQRFGCSTNRRHKIYIRVWLPVCMVASLLNYLERWKKKERKRKLSLCWYPLA